MSSSFNLLKKNLPSPTQMRKKQIRNNFDRQWGGGCVFYILPTHQPLEGPLFQLIIYKDKNFIKGKFLDMIDSYTST